MTRNHACALLVIAASLFGCKATAPTRAGADTLPTFPSRAFDVLHYDAEITPDIAHGQVSGRVRIRLRAGPHAVTTLRLDSDGLQVDSAVYAGHALHVTQGDRSIELGLPQPLQAGAVAEIALHYHGTPGYGLKLNAQRQQAYTIFATTQWLIGIAAPDERATLELRVNLPAALTAAASGEPHGSRRLADGRRQFRWRQTRAVPAYTFGFVAGRFKHVEQHGRGLTLHYLGDGFDASQLRQLFADTDDMLRYFAQRAGVPYAGAHYAQALVVDTIGQEMSGLSLYSEAYAREVLADPSGIGLMAHEAAHQWWGNQVTCRDWTHFWLNEGMATFLAATYLEHRFGRERYEQSVMVWKQRLDKLRHDQHDKPLVFADWNAPSADDRAVVYQKGAYVLHQLREHMGEAAFWRGLATYTQRHFGASVVTADLQQAMQSATPQDLAPFFAQWVYASETAVPIAAAQARNLPVEHPH